MNIALFSDSYLPTKSGIVTVVIQLRKILTEMGHHVVIVTVGSHESEQNEEKDPDVLRVYSIPSPLGENQYIGFPHKKKVIEFLKKNKIEIIHSHTEFYIAHAAKQAGKALHIPVIASTHTMWEDFYKFYLPMGKIIPVRLVRKIVWRVYKKFYAFINVSEKAHDYFKEPFMLPNTPSAVIPNAIDTKAFLSRKCSDEDLENIRKSWGIESNEQLLLFVGRVVEEKRVEELFNICVKVLRQRENVKVMFVGSGGAIYDLEKTTRKLGLEHRIIFTGFVNWENLSRYYGIGSIFVTASLSEMHSMTALEALLSHLPIVCRKDESFFDTVYQGQNGYMADTDEELENYIIELLDDPEKQKQFGEKSYEISKNFSMKTHGRRTLEFYKAVLKYYPQPVTDAILQKAVDSVVMEQD
ncbi:MAG: glycosyltransferase [Treponema sp.]|nr:glycosyltransferase [Treponema sp.]